MFPWSQAESENVGHYSWKNDLNMSHVHPTCPRRLAFFWFSPKILIIPKLLLYFWEFCLAAQYIFCGNPVISLVFRDCPPVPGPSAILSGALSLALLSSAPLSSILGSYTFHKGIPVERFGINNRILNTAKSLIFLIMFVWFCQWKKQILIITR